MKRTHKLAALGDVGPIVQAASSVSAAAKRLGVSRVTIHDWIRKGIVPRPAGRKPRQPADDTRPVVLPATPAAWAADVRERYDLTTTEYMLVRLAEEVLGVALDATQKPTERIAAAGRFQTLVKQLNLEVEDGEIETGEVHAFPRRVG
jgi:transposase-like protein